MSKCTTTLKNINWCQGKPNYSGVKRRAFIAARAGIVSYPDYPRDANGNPTSAIMQGNYVMAEGEKFYVIEHNPEKAEFKAEAQGEFPSVTFKNDGTLVTPDVGPDTTAALAALANVEVVLIYEDMHGRFRVLGNEKWGARVTPSQSIGQGPTGSSVSTVAVSATDEVSMGFYNGPIPTVDGVINEGATSGTPS